MTRILLSLAFLCMFSMSFAQKSPISLNDFKSWETISSRIISNNGQYIAYEMNEQHGNGKLIIHTISSGENDTIEYAYNAKFSALSDYIIYKIKPDTDSIRQAKLDDVKDDDLPKDSVGIFVLNSGEKITIPNIKSFKVPQTSSSWSAIMVGHEKEIEKDSTASDSIVVKPTIEKDVYDLRVINPITDSSYLFFKVKDYCFSKNGAQLAYISEAKDSTNLSHVLLFDTEKLTNDTVFTLKGEVENIKLDHKGTQFAFLSTDDTTKNKTYQLNFFNINKSNLQTILDTLSTEVPENWCVSKNKKLSFSDDDTKLYFGIAPRPEKEKKDTILKDEKAKLDIWSWTDIDLQPKQLLNLDKEKKRTFLTVYRITENEIIPLADSTVQNIYLLNRNNGEFAFGTDDTPYRRATSWNGKWIRNYYLVDIKNGNKKQILKGKSNAKLSPNGEYTTWYETQDSCFYIMNNQTLKAHNVSSYIPFALYDEKMDMPTDPYSYGIVGWTQEENFLLLYDRYDIWKIDPKGKSEPQNITNGFGRTNKIRLRYRKLDPELVYVPLNEEIILSGFNENNNQEGYYSLIFNEEKNPQALFVGDFSLNNLKKAKNSDQIIWSKESVSQYPEITTSNLSFDNPNTISQCNKKQADYNWATNEIVTWTSFAGDSLRGILYKPEDFDPTKNYPMVVYFYEKSSDSQHRHYTPYPSRSIINKTFYASNGYLVFVPDINYTTGNPGQDAYNAVVSGVQYLINTQDYINEKKIGLQGQSWGGYQIAYLVTQTNLFAAAMAGAPVSNMTSAYGGIRWGSGMSRMFQYEHTQSRIGGTLWDKPMQYIENSPVFYAPKVNTPLLIMHNDNDGAVPWYQGIEYFVALRRLDKPVWMLNYNGMKHNIESKYWANRMDLSTRMLDFFNHYLKDEPAPEWMIKGRPATEK